MLITLYLFGIFHNDRENDFEGYTSFKAPFEMEGHVGEALTDLRPSGYALIDNKRMEVFSDGQFILKGSTVQVYQIKEGKIRVRQIG